MKFCQFQLCIYFILQIIVVSLCGENTSEDFSENTPDDGFIDPHSIYYIRQTEELQKLADDAKRISHSSTIITDSVASFIESVNSVDCNCDQKFQEWRDEKTNTLPFELFSRRLVNILLSQATLKKENEIFEGNIHIKATISQLQALRDFGNGKESTRTIDAIISEIIKTPATSYLENAITYSELIFSNLSTHKYTCIGIFLAISVLLLIRSRRWTIGMFISCIIILIFVISFFMTWYQLVQEAKIKQTAKQIMYAKLPIECQPEKMGMIQYITSKFSFRGNIEECEKYFEAMMIDPVVQVTPAKALSHLCTHLILEPISLAGHMVANFVDNATEKLPWPLKWLITPLLFIGLVLHLVRLPFSLFGALFGFGIGPLSYFTINQSKEKRNRQLNNIRRRERIELLEEMPNNMINQNIEMDRKRQKRKAKILKLELPEKSFIDEEIQSENSSTSEYFDKAGGDFATTDEDNEKEACIQELSDKKDQKTKTIQEIGSGDS